mmetsp:Transcript_36497/g.53461  ORF Transcript_36497/g.53461 Transcript_36497/m.53461 type:complete len:403 (-) Transcript_36497:47-1255(-)
MFRGPSSWVDTDVDGKEFLVEAMSAGEEGLPLGTDADAIGFRDEYLVLSARSTVYRLSHIDSSEQTFFAEVFLRLSVDINDLGGDPEEMLEYLLKYEPKLELMNLDEGDEPAFQGSGIEQAEDHRILYYDFMIKGKFSERLDLRPFPFDTQQIRVRIALKEYVLGRHTSDPQQITLNKSIILPNEKGSRAVIIAEGTGVKLLPSTFHDSDVWWLEDNVRLHASLSDPAASSSLHQYANLDLIFNLRRKSPSYIYNIMLPTAVLTTFAWLTSGVQRADLGNRCQITLTLLLTTVAFKFVVSDTLPPVSYLTFLDKYLLVSAGAVCAMVAANFLAWFFDSLWVDFWLLSGLLAAWVVYNALAYLEAERYLRAGGRFVKEYVPGPAAEGRPWRFTPPVPSKETGL